MTDKVVVRELKVRGRRITGVFYIAGPGGDRQ